MYIVEMIKVNRVVVVLHRSRYYENADDAYCEAKRDKYLELRLLRYDKDRGRVLLKLSSRSRSANHSLLKECSEDVA